MFQKGSWFGVSREGFQPAKALVRVEIFSEIQMHHRLRWFERGKDATTFISLLSYYNKYIETHNYLYTMIIVFVSDFTYLQYIVILMNQRCDIDSCILHGFVASDTFDVFKTERRIWQDKMPV